MCLTPNVWYTGLDAQCDKVSTVVGRLLIALATVDVPWHNFYKSTVWDKVLDENSALIFENIPFSLQFTVG